MNLTLLGVLRKAIFCGPLWSQPHPLLMDYTPHSQTIDQVITPPEYVCELYAVRCFIACRAYYSRGMRIDA